MLHYKETGAGPTLAVLHGLFGSGDNWRSLAKAFSARARTLLVDMPNHGASPHTDDMRYPSMAESVAELIGHVARGPAFVLGHSMGGKVAMALALAHPELVRGIIVADIAPKSYPPRHTEILRGMKKVGAAEARSRKEADAVLAEHVPSKPVRAFLLKSLKADERGVYRWQLHVDGISDCYDHLTAWPQIEGRFEGPALFVAGGKSDYVSPDDIGDIQRLFPHASLESIDDAGHWLHVEQRELFTELVTDFLAEHS